MDKTKRRILIIVSIIFIMVVPFIPYGDYDKDELVGVYVTNYTTIRDNPPPANEIPSGRDTLILFENMRYKSGWYGEGKYRIYVSSGHPYIGLISDSIDLFGGDIIVTTKSLYDRTPKLYLNLDLNYYYKKVK